jgi:uncharacterized repeat protein (TIGR03803 family)
VFCLPFALYLIEAANADVLCTQNKEDTMQLTSLMRAAATLAVLSLLLLIPSHKAHAQTEIALYSFCSDLYCYDGASPYGSLTPDGYGDFFGTASLGGASSCYFNEYCYGGVVFQLIPEPTGGCPTGSNPGSGWCQFVVYNFCSALGNYTSDCPDGELPYAALTAVWTGPFSNRTLHLFGTTFNGGTGANCTDPDGCGTVFELSPKSPPESCPSGTTPGNNGWCETVIYNFCSQASCADGLYPMSGLVRDSSGNLYGTVSNGVFELSPNSSGGWNEALIYPYNSDTNTVQGGLAMDSAGDLYGVDQNIYTGGGDVFMLNLDRVPTTIHTFSGSLTDGSLPNGQPVVDSAGNVYGTTYEGGRYNQGIVWKLTPVTTGKEAGTYEEKILHTFSSAASGDYPYAGVTLDSSGNIYGTTTQGGKYQACTNSTGSKTGCGTVFELAVSDATYKFKILTSFNGPDGAIPADSPVLDSSGRLYGTTLSGGANGGGTVFAVNPAAAATTTTLTPSLNPSISGEAVTFTATVSSSAGAPPDGETVSFMKGSTVLGTGTLSGGEASFTTSSLPVGTSVVDAVYSGDLNFEPGTSNKVKEVVKK